MCRGFESLLRYHRSPIRSSDLSPAFPVAGNIGSWEQDGKRFVGYWVGREFWGKGVATRALQEFVGEVTKRPLHAWVAASNVGSIRVLEKCGFVQVDSRTTDVEELLFQLP